MDEQLKVLMDMIKEMKADIEEIKTGLVQM